MAENYYDFEYKGIKRKLPYIKLSEELAITSFCVISDTELVCAAAPDIVAELPEVDVLMTAEAKGICLCAECSRLLGMKDFVVARKSKKPYMKNVLEHTVFSITTQKEQTLYLDGSDAEKLRGRRVALIDDVISTGDSVAAIEALALAAGAQVAAKACICAEDKAADRDDIIYLEKLFLFRPNEDGSFSRIG